MPGLRGPLFSLGASGRLSRAFTLARRLTGPGWLLRGRPADPKTEPQLSWRTMWQLAARLWHQLSPEERAIWEQDGTAHGMTGFARYMSQALRPNPGIYLPLAGGTMSGEIDMDNNAIGGLVDPTTDDKAARKAYVDAHVGSDYPLSTYLDFLRWRLPGWFIANTNTKAITAGRIYYTPIFVSETTTFIRIGCEVTAGVAGTTDLRIFAFTNGLPGALILNAGTVDTTAAAFKQVVINHELTRGYYFLASRSTAAPTFKVPNKGSALSTPVDGFFWAATMHLQAIILCVDAAYADPAPAPDDGLSPEYNIVCLREN